MGKKRSKKGDKRILTEGVQKVTDGVQTVKRILTEGIQKVR